MSLPFPVFSSLSEAEEKGYQPQGRISTVEDAVPLLEQMMARGDQVAVAKTQRYEPDQPRLVIVLRYVRDAWQRKQVAKNEAIRGQVRTGALPRKRRKSGPKAKYHFAPGQVWTGRTKAGRAVQRVIVSMESGRSLVHSPVTFENEDGERRETTLAVFAKWVSQVGGSVKGE